MVDVASTPAEIAGPELVAGEVDVALRHPAQVALRQSRVLVVLKPSVEDADTGGNHVNSGDGPGDRVRSMPLREGLAR